MELASKKTKLIVLAGVVQLADTRSLGFRSRKALQVRILSPAFYMNRTIMSNAIARYNITGVIILWIEYSGKVDGSPHLINYQDLHANGSYDTNSVVFIDPTGVEDR